MMQKIAQGYLIFSLVFALGFLGFAVLRIRTAWDRNKKKAEESFTELEVIVSSGYLSYGDFASEPFLKEVRNALAQQPRILLASIYSLEGNLHYVYANERTYIDAEQKLAPGMQPTYNGLPLGSALFERPFAAPAEESLRINGSYIVLGREDLFPIVRESFIILFIFFVATAIVLLLLPGGKIKPEKAGAMDTASGTADGKILFSPRTGLGWQYHFSQRLKFELDRAASSDQDLVLALTVLDSYSSLSNPEQIYGRIARMILEDFSFQDLAFEYGEGSYAIIIPDSDLNKGIGSLTKFQKKVSSATRPPVTLTIGLSSRSGRLIDGVTIVSEATSALERAQGEGINQLMAFRANPEKYRAGLSEGKA
jgi:GGDEF domain-containing protein